MHFGSFYCSHVNPYSPKNESKAHCLSQKMQAKTAQKVNDTDMFMCLCSKPISRTAFMVSQKKKKRSQNNKNHIKQEIKIKMRVCKQDFWLTSTHEPWKHALHMCLLVKRFFLPRQHCWIASQTASIRVAHQLHTPHVRLHDVVAMTSHLHTRTHSGETHSPFQQW